MKMPLVCRFPAAPQARNLERHWKRNGKPMNQRNTMKKHPRTVLLPFLLAMIAFCGRSSLCMSTGPLPEKDSPVDYHASKSFAPLYQWAWEHHRDLHCGEGRVVIGKLRVEGAGDSLDGVATKAVFAEHGIFVAPLYAGRTLRFVKHGFEPLEVTLPPMDDGTFDSVLDLGERTLRRLPEENTVDASLDLVLPEGIPSARVELWTGKLPSTWHDDGYDGDAPIEALAIKMESEGGRIELHGLTPMPYEWRISAPGCMAVRQPFDASRRETLDPISLIRTKTATFRLARFDQSGDWQEKQVCLDGNARLVVKDEPDQFGQFDDLRLTYRDENHLEAFFVYWPNTFDDLGENGQNAFLAGTGGHVQPAPRGNHDASILETGHLYRFRCPQRNLDLLVSFTGME